MKTNQILLTLIISGLIASQSTFATGIPVVDGAAIAQTAANFAQQLAQMAKQYKEMEAQFKQLESQTKSMTGASAIAHILPNGGMSNEVKATFDSLLRGNITGLTNTARRYLDNLPDCSGSKNPSLCQSAQLAGVAKLDFINKINNQIHDKLQKIQELSQRANQADDLKTLTALQAQIQLEGNSIKLMNQELENFKAMQEAQKQIASQQAVEQYSHAVWASYKKSQNSANRSGSYDSLLDN